MRSFSGEGFLKKPGEYIQTYNSQYGDTEVYDKYDIEDDLDYDGDDENGSMSLSENEIVGREQEDFRMMESKVIEYYERNRHSNEHTSIPLPVLKAEHPYYEPLIFCIAFCLDNSLPLEKVTTIIQKYPRDCWAVIDRLGDVIYYEKYPERYILDEFSETGMAYFSPDEISSIFRKEAIRIIDHFSSGDIKQSDVQKSLDSIKETRKVFISIFDKVQMSETENYQLDDFHNAEYEVYTPSEISTEMFGKLVAIYKGNYSENVGSKLVEEFTERFKNPESSIWIFSHKGEPLSFLMMTPSDNGSMYCSAFNVATDARGHGIGEKMLDETIDYEAQQHVLEAECDAKLPISSKYIETGWIACGLFQDGDDQILQIERDDSHSTLYWGKNDNVTKEEIVAREGVPHQVVIASGHTQAELPFEKLANGLVLTRMFKYELTGRSRYYGVFEPIRKKQSMHQAAPDKGIDARS